MTPSVAKPRCPKTVIVTSRNLLTQLPCCNISRQIIPPPVIPLFFLYTKSYLVCYSTTCNPIFLYIKILFILLISLTFLAGMLSSVGSLRVFYFACHMSMRHVYRMPTLGSIYVRLFACRYPYLILPHCAKRANIEVLPYLTARNARILRFFMSSCPHISKC